MSMGKTTTTISLDRETIKKLLKIGGFYTIQEGKKFNYNDTIKKLIAEHQCIKK